MSETMDERKKIINQVMDYDCIAALWRFAQSKLPLNIETEAGVTILSLLALAWVIGAHHALAFSEITSELLADSDEVYRLVRDNWTNMIGDDFPLEDIDNLVQYAMEAEEYLPVVRLVPKDFSLDMKIN